MALDFSNFQFTGGENTEELFASARELLPLKDDQFKIVSVRGKTNSFKAEVLSSIKTVEEIHAFIENYKIQNDETLRSRTATKLGAKSDYVLSLYYRCHHRTTHVKSYNPVETLKRNPSKRMKNTDCPFSLSFKILKIPANGMSCNISLQWNHNHPVNSLQALSFKDIPAHIRDEITDMYHRQYTPGLAYREFVKNIMSRSKDDLEFHKFLADRSIAPRRRDFNKFYKDFKDERFGAKDLKSMLEKLGEKVPYR